MPLGPDVEATVVNGGGGGGGGAGWGGGGGWSRPDHAVCSAATLRFVSVTMQCVSAAPRRRSATLLLSAATTVERDSRVIGAPAGEEASEVVVEPGPAPAEENGGASEIGGVGVDTDGAGGGPDIADTKLLGFLVLPVRDRRL